MLLHFSAALLFTPSATAFRFRPRSRDADKTELLSDSLLRCLGSCDFDSTQFEMNEALLRFRKGGKL